jgi:putative ABC transport system permease protein
MKFLPLVWSNLMRRKFRSICTTLSILIAFVLIGALLSIRAGFSRGVDVTGADRLVVTQKTSMNQPMPLAYRERLAAIPGVAVVTYAGWFRGTYQNPGNAFPQLAVDTDTWFEMYRDLWSVPEDQLARWKADRIGVIVGPRLVERFGWKIGDRIPLQSAMWPKSGGGAWEFIVDGVYSESAARRSSLELMFFHYAYLNDARALGHDLVDSYRVRVIEPARANEVAEAIDAAFANSVSETTTSTENAFVRAIAEQIGDVGAIVIAILGPVLFTIVLVCGNTMAQAIRERTNELAVLKTLGFTDRRLLALVLLESSVLPIVAGTIGLCIWLLIQRTNPTGGVVPMAPLSLPNIGIAALFAVTVGLIAGVAPMWHVHRLAVVDALRRER